MADDSHSFGNTHYTARVTAQGAELCSLRDASGRELMWTGSAWPRHSPVLFPIIGRMRDNRAQIDGLDYTLTQHGFARERKFRWVERTTTGCTLVLEDDPALRALFPYAFSLTLAYAVDETGLHLTYTLHNPDDRRTLHASLGAHPAFVWPLQDGVAKDEHVLEFSNPEPAPIGRLHEGLLQTERVPSPVEGNVLHLRETLFERDALIFLDPTSRTVTFRPATGAALRFAWTGFEQLGVWTKPGADFLCIEPWKGYASPEDFDGPFEEKPGQLHLAPGQRWTAGWSVGLTDA